MSTTLNFDLDCEFFSAKRLAEIIILRFKENLLFQATDLSTRDKILYYLDRVSKIDSIKIVVIFGASKGSGKEEYFDFYHQAFKQKWDQYPIHKIQNVFAQFILKIMGLNKLVIHANSGCVISLFLSVSLACDYRIIASDTVFQNPFLRLGLTPIGGGAFFLSKMIGPSKAYKILLSGNDVTADEALQLGIVDEVVPTGNLEPAALDAARRFAEKPARSLAAVKKLINFSMRDLREYMDIEHKELIRIVESHDYIDAVAENVL